MKTERLDVRLTVLRPVAVTDEYGATTQGGARWEEVRVIWADRNKMTGDSVNEAGEVFSDYRAEYRIRWACQVPEGWRVRERDSMEYVVRNVIPDRRNGLRTLKCEKINR